jgi:hypothetical protein
MTADLMRERLVGAWRLEAFVTVAEPDGDVGPGPLGPPTGLLVYDGNGYSPWR